MLHSDGCRFNRPIKCENAWDAWWGSHFNQFLICARSSAPRSSLFMISTCGSYVTCHFIALIQHHQRAMNIASYRRRVYCNNKKRTKDQWNFSRNAALSRFPCKFKRTNMVSPHAKKNFKKMLKWPPIVIPLRVYLFVASLYFFITLFFFHRGLFLV